MPGVFATLLGSTQPLSYFVLYFHTFQMYFTKHWSQHIPKYCPYIRISEQTYANGIPSKADVMLWTQEQNYYMGQNFRDNFMPKSDKDLFRAVQIKIILK